MHYVDVTDLVRYVRTRDTLTGIQRVVVSVIARLAAKLGPDNVRLCELAPGADRLLVRPGNALLDLPSLDVPDLRRALGVATTGGVARRIAPTLEAYAGDRLKYALNHAVRDLNAVRARTVHFERRGSSLEEWRTYRAARRARSPKLPDQPRYLDDDGPGAGDTVLVPGVIWTWSEHTELMRRARERGASVAYMLYDLIPLRLPHLVDLNTERVFRGWFERTVTWCPHWIATSDATARDLREELDRLGASPRVSVIPLAQRMEGTAPSAATPDPRADWAMLRPEVTATLTRPFVLAVGTMEVRKNNWGLAQAWQRLVADPTIDPPRLVFAGRPGWKNDAFADWMRASANMQGWVSIIDGPSDREVRFLYEHCLFGAMVSHYEGWGLPVGECLSYGRTAVVARNSSLPEVGGDMVEYCEAGSIVSIAAAARALLDTGRRGELERRIAETRLREWDDVGDELARAIA